MPLPALFLAALFAVSCSSSYRSMSENEEREFLIELEAQTFADLVEVGSNFDHAFLTVLSGSNRF